MPQGLKRKTTFEELLEQEHRPSFEQLLEKEQQLPQQPPPSRVNWGTGEFLPGETARHQREAFAQKPLLTQWGERAYDALARGGGQLSKMARQTLETGMGVAQGLQSGDFSPVPIQPWRKFEAERNAELQAQREGRPSSL